MQYKVYTNRKDGRTLVDLWEPEHKTLEALVYNVYRGEYAKVDEYTNEGHYVRAFYISPDEDGDMVMRDADNTIFHL
jgi:hypothetical protein